jgi:uncharacterized protein YbjT (DUF2867 family)
MAAVDTVAVAVAETVAGTVAAGAAGAERSGRGRRPARAPKPAVLIAGGTGLVGSELGALLLARKPAPRLHQLVRSVPANADARAAWLVVDFAALPELPAAQQAYCCLGTTIKQAGSQQAFRAVDFDAVLVFARAAQAAGVRRFAVVSALGANPRASSFYSRVKGEMEAALAALKFDSLVIARPTLLAGERAALGKPARRADRLALRLSKPLAFLLPKALRPIEARCVARALLQAMQQATPGVRIVESAELQQIGR